MDEKQKYTAFSIPKRDVEPEKEAVTNAWKNPAKAVLFPSNEFAEIEYEYNPVSAPADETERRTFTLVPASQLIGKRTIDPVRQKFYDMRALASVGPFARNDSELAGIARIGQTCWVPTQQEGRTS